MNDFCCLESYRGTGPIVFRPGLNLRFRMCVQAGHLTCIEHFVSCGGNVNGIDWGHFQSPLGLAIESKKLDAAKLLLKLGADVNSVNLDSKRPILYDAISGSSQKTDHKFVKLLIEHGVDVNMIDGTGKSPLFYAAIFGLDKVVKLLLDSGADIELMLGNDSNVLEYLRKNRIFYESTKLILDNHVRTLFGRRAHADLLNISLALVQLDLPTYVVMWIVDFLDEFTAKPEIRKIRLREGVWRSRRAILAKREENKKN